MYSNQKTVDGNITNSADGLIIIQDETKYFKKCLKCAIDYPQNQICDKYQVCEIVNKSTTPKECKKSTYEKASNFMELNNYEEAIVHLDGLLTITPYCWKVILKKGICLKHLNRLSDAIDTFDLGLHLDPNNENLLREKLNTLEIIRISKSKSKLVE